MIEEYCKFSGIEREEFDMNFSSLEESIQDSNYDVILKGGKNATYLSFKLEFNTNTYSLESKLSLFSPQMLPLISSGYSTFLEHMGDFGVLSEIIKIKCPEMSVTYSNVESDIYHFVKWRFETDNIDIKTYQLDDNYRIYNKYDIIVSDGKLQFFTEDKQVKIVKNIVDNLNPNGIFCLLVDLSGKSSSPLNNDVNITNIHSVLEDLDVVCIYGKNTFSSVWKKMI